MTSDKNTGGVKLLLTNTCLCCRRILYNVRKRKFQPFCFWLEPNIYFIYFNFFIFSQKIKFQLTEQILGVEFRVCFELDFQNIASGLKNSASWRKAKRMEIRTTISWKCTPSCFEMQKRRVTFKNAFALGQVKSLPSHCGERK